MPFVFLLFSSNILFLKPVLVCMTQLMHILHLNVCKVSIGWTDHFALPLLLDTQGQFPPFRVPVPVSVSLSMCVSFRVSRCTFPAVLDPAKW